MAPSDDTPRRIPELSTGDQVPLHPALTDLPVATLSLAPVFDAIGLFTGSQSAGAAGLWTGTAAVLTSVPTAATGVLDYLRAPGDGPVKRIGIRHAALNTFALSMIIGSLVSRRFRSEPTPLSLVFSAVAGATVIYSSHLGGVMVYREGMRVAAVGGERTSSHAAGETPGVDEWAGGGATAAPLGETAEAAATIGGPAEDSPDIMETGATPGAGPIPATAQAGPVVTEGGDNPDDVALEARADEERRDEASAA